MEALFRRDGDALLPGELTQGPWNPEHQHGGAVCAALAWAIERCPTPVPMRPVRLVFDLMHPVPLRALRPEVRVVRAGKRIQVLDAALLEGERPVARASALQLRVDASLADLEAGALGAKPGSVPEATPAMQRRRFGDGFSPLPGFIRAVELRRVELEPRTGEPATIWARLRVPVVEGEEPTPFQRLAAVADFVSGTANGIDFTRYVSINPDVSLRIQRLPETEWLAIESRTLLGPDGVGMSHGVVHDERGALATAQAALYLAER